MFGMLMGNGQLLAFSLAAVSMWTVLAVATGQGPGPVPAVRTRKNGTDGAVGPAGSGAAGGPAPRSSDRYDRADRRGLLRRPAGGEIGRRAVGRPRAGGR